MNLIIKSKNYLQKCKFTKPIAKAILKTFAMAFLKRWEINNMSTEIDNLELLEKLADLKEKGILSQEEFDTKKKALLNPMQEVAETKEVEEETNGDIKKIIAKHKEELDYDSVFFYPDIPDKKLSNAKKSYAKNAKDIIMLFDDTVFGGAKEGIILTKDYIYAKELGCSGVVVKLKNIKKSRVFKNTLILNEKEFVTMKGCDFFRKIIGLMKEFIPPSNDSSNNKKIDNNNNEKSNVGKMEGELHNIIEAYNYPKNFKLLAALSDKQINNFCDNCEIHDSSKLIALIDTTLWLSGKNGVGFFEDKIVWRNFALQDVESLSYEEIYNGRISINDDKINICGKMIEPTRKTDINGAKIKVIIESLIQNWQERCLELSIVDLEEKELLKQLPIAKQNYFNVILSNMTKGNTLRGLGRHIDDFFNTMHAVSVEQKNEAYRRNPFQENADEKNELFFTYRILAIANSFSAYIRKKDPSYSKFFVENFQNEYVTFEMLIYIIYRITILMGEAGLKNEIIIVLDCLDRRILTPFYQHKFENDTNISTLKKGMGMTDDYVRNLDANKLSGGRMKTYQKWDRHYLGWLCRNILSVNAIKKYSDIGGVIHSITEEEENRSNKLSDFYEKRLTKSVKDIYNKDLDKVLDDLILKYLR